MGTGGPHVDTLPEADGRNFAEKGRLNQRAGLERIDGRCDFAKVRCVKDKGYEMVKSLGQKCKVKDRASPR